MKRTIRVLFLILALSGLAAPLQAQTFAVYTQLNFKQQDPSILVGEVYTDRVRTLRLDSNTLLALLAAGYTTNYPNGFPYGARLMLVDFNHFQVQSFTGAILVSNTAPYLTYSDTFSQTNYLFQGKENIATDYINHTYFYQSTIQFQDPVPNGISFTFTGNTQERYVRSVADIFGDHLSQGSLFVTGIGTGRNGDSFVLLSGKFTMQTTRWIE
jgi:hypothetical protein